MSEHTQPVRPRPSGGAPVGACPIGSLADSGNLAAAAGMSGLEAPAPAGAAGRRVGWLQAEFLDPRYRGGYQRPATVMPSTRTVGASVP